MADWKLTVSYNYNPSYHAYAYGLMYPQGSEQTHQNLSWTEAVYNQSSGISGGYYSSQPTQQSPPRSPEDVAQNNEHYPGSPLYFTDSQAHTQNGRLFISNNHSQYDQLTKETELPNSDTQSDSEAHTPDSWSSASSRESCVPQTNTSVPVWGKKDGSDETDGGSPESSESVSSSVSVKEYDPTSVVLGTNTLPPTPSVVPSPPEKAATGRPKPKLRTAFSEEQMNALICRFNMQRYLTPPEMRTLADLTGLSYKQVKTWFQNRRMKLKRHQKDNSWVSERFPNNGYPNISTQQTLLQNEAHRLIRDPYSNQQMRDAFLKKSPPQTPFYLNYPRPLSPPQVPTRPQANWPLPPAVTHYDYPNPAGYGNNTSINVDDCSTTDPNTSPERLTAVHSATQWSS
ncbi:homeobox protein NANOG [Chanos chanos]|uniref:Homeobox protein NANOG n=1 Tax=Chanos chanos TaxID=29144 RepID=A0A6J2V0M5_CHACN|nr:homeobox protein Hox-B5-like [Chanos chanos]